MNIRLGASILLLLTQVFFGVSFAATSRVEGRLLDDVRISEGEQCSKIVIALTLPIQYIRHFPVNQGDELRIELRPLRVGRSDVDAIFKRESFVYEHSKTLPLSEILYEPDFPEGGPFLTLTFDRIVSYFVKPGIDHRSLIIFIANPGQNLNREICIDFDSNQSLGILQRLNYQSCLSMAPSSVLRQGLHSPLCAPLRALNTKPYPAQSG